MKARFQILPGTGRGTIRRMVEGARPAPPASVRRPAPSVSRYAPATSPYRGGFRQHHQATPVTLNSFQGPFLLPRRSVVKGANGTAVRTMRAAESEAQWMLKQVQHDGIVREESA